VSLCATLIVNGQQKGEFARSSPIS
jgi:hypothetical protein